MKRMNRYSLCWLFLLLVLFEGCEKDEPMGYIGRPGFYFNGNEFSYSFAENPWKTVDTVMLPVIITGKLENYARTLKAEVVKDSSTATENMYQLLEGTLGENQSEGFIPVVLKYVPSLDDITVTLKIQAVANDDFQELDLVFPSCRLNFTAKIMKPFNWSQLQYFFGTYSTRWWRFIMEKCERTSLPFWDDLWSPIPNPDPSKYNMSYYEMSNLQEMIRQELRNYNRNSLTGPLTHDDGDLAGQQVVMPAPY